MLNQTQTWTLLALLSLSSAIFAQTATENYLLFDAACMKKYDYERNSDYHDQPFWDYHVSSSGRQITIFRVIKQDIYRDETASLEREPIRCEDVRAINTEFIEEVNNSKKTVYVAEYDKSKKMYQLYQVKRVIVFSESPQILYYKDLTYRFIYKKNELTQGLDIDTSANGRVLFQSNNKYLCHNQRQFRVYDNVNPRLYEDWSFVENIGLVKIARDKGVLELKTINSVPLANYAQQKCANTFVGRDTAGTVITKPENGDKTIGGSGIENPFGTKKPQKIDTTGFAAQGYYVVQEGDNLYKIARQFNTKVDVIMSLNGMSSSAIDKGMKLKVRDDGTFQQQNPIIQVDEVTGVKTKLHTVSQGENLWDIAQKYKTTTTKIKQLNGIPDNSDRIDIRQVLIIEVIKPQ